MAEKIKVVNSLKSRITINLTKLNGKEIPIEKNGFALLTVDELAYLQNVSKAFDLGYLRLAPKQIIPEEVEIADSFNAISDEEISKLLQKPVKTLESELVKLTNVYVLKRVLEIAGEQDKSVKVMKIIEDRIENLLS